MSRRRLLATAQIAVNDRTNCTPGIRELIRTIGGNRVRSPQPVARLHGWPALLRLAVLDVGAGGQGASLPATAYFCCDGCDVRWCGGTERPRHNPQVTQREFTWWIAGTLVRIRYIDRAAEHTASAASESTAGPSGLGLDTAPAQRGRATALTAPPAATGLGRCKPGARPGRPAPHL